MKKGVIRSVVVFCIIILFCIALLFNSGYAENPQIENGNVGSGQDIVSIALTQVGNVGGEPYWSWYGFESHVAWCACFVSWCANEADYIDQGIIPKFALCTAGVDWFKERNQWKEVEGYVAKAGDIVFFDWDNNGRSDHVGIVQYEEGGKVVTIEGNTSNESNANGNACEIKIRNKNNILGYGTPMYPSNSVDLEGNSVEEQVFYYLTKRGFSKASAAGIMGNMYQESRVNPTTIQGNGRGPAAGICQWENYNTKAGRFKGLEDRANAEGKPWTDLKVQLDFLVEELQGADPTTKYLLDSRYGGLAKFMSSADVEWTTEVFEKCFERAGKPNMPKRIVKAKEYYERYK